MTKEEFHEIFDQHAVAGCLPIRMLNGRYGLIPHWTDEEVLVDVYDNKNTLIEEKRLPYAQVKTLGGGALIETEEVVS